MASMELELLPAARLLVARAPGERGRISRARVRRAILVPPLLQGRIKAAAAKFNTYRFADHKERALRETETGLAPGGATG